MANLNIQWLEAAHHWEGREGQQPRWLILHGTAGFHRAYDCAAFFADPATQASAHYIIGLDGEIYQCVSEDDAAWANGAVTGPAGTGGDSVHHDAWWSDLGLNPNLVTIAIEHIKPSTDNSDELTEAQKRASFQLIKDICQRWGIPKRYADARGGITGHFSMDPVNRTGCPGPYPWDELWSFLNENEGDQKMGIPNGWKDDGKTLIAPNGVKVVQGFRDYVLAHAWHPGNWPLESEHGATPLEISNPSLGGGTQQRFRWTTLEWTPAKGVFEAWSGQEWIKLRSEYDRLTGQVKQLQDQLAAEKGKNHAIEVEKLKQQLAQYQQVAKQALTALQSIK
ncbi:N-acetylmuramoyl-L-alanine amidase [Thermosporothrix hazakensis]|jgi:N-acetyl-anhydromuramyl-L-alanine amidase AmpD|uniref:N-acetylmuramoyl-L-alanine amidase n=1 Tax=Thermosporothrix hazakensis TaxID=644383 RepID=A0A326TT16_THEHA|nr:peptidoglycan recognition family protein [Thermosporothrix hazakensis]PZW19681.1 N-acetylmuramoyl-L-alanine amidase [Thermosporothrix hazakensis]GCE49207.1 hypothetical protein KTH_40760 [Thermosporothrix hazakensis]